MGVVVAHRAVHLGQERHLGNALTRGVHAHEHIGQLFAHRGGAGSLAMGATEHGVVGVLVGHGTQLVLQGIDARQQHLGAHGLELQRMAGVVDVFAGASEMNELQSSGKLCLQLGRQTGRLALRFEPILDSLHIVVGGFFNLFDGQGIRACKVMNQIH